MKKKKVMGVYIFILLMPSFSPKIIYKKNTKQDKKKEKYGEQFNFFHT